MTKRTLLLLAVLMLLLAACSGGGSTTTTDPNVLFQDDFSQTSSGWDRYTGDDAITDYNNGVYRMWVNSDNTDIWANPGLNFQDVRVEVKATKIAGPDDNDFGVICRYQDVENFYFMIVSSDGYYGIGAVEAGEQYLIGTEELFTSEEINQGDASNDLRGDCVGDKLTLYVNGTQLHQVQDSTFTSGDVGLIAGSFDTVGVDIEFDNFKVLKP